MVTEKRAAEKRAAENALLEKTTGVIAERICDRYAQERNFSGVCMVKRAGSSVFERAYGYASRPFRIPNRIDTRFDTASITKIFTAAAVLLLVEQGKLCLDDKIVDLIDLSGTKIPADVTIEQLLNHTSGIADDAEEEAGEEYSALFVDSPNYALRECRDFLKNFAWKEPNFPAGTDVRYCNCSFILLGLAIEAVTGEAYRDYVVRNIFEQAGMSSTGFFSMDGVAEHVAEGYKSVLDEAGNIIDYRKNIYSYPPVGTPDGGAYTTAGDLNRFLEAVKDGTLFKQGYGTALLSPHCPFIQNKELEKIPGLRKTNGYAFEFLLLEGYDTPFCIYKDGCNDGVSAIFCYYPPQELTLTVLSNQECNVWKMKREIQLDWYQAGVFGDSGPINRNRSGDSI